MDKNKLQCKNVQPLTSLLDMCFKNIKISSWTRFHNVQGRFEYIHKLQGPCTPSFLTF
jgi:hypothetical protein